MAKTKHITLVAATVATVNLAVNASRVEVVNRSGSAEVYFTVNGATPTVGGDDTHVLPAAIGSVEVPDEIGGDVVVKLISSGTPTVSVRAL